MLDIGYYLESSSERMLLKEVRHLDDDAFEALQQTDGSFFSLGTIWVKLKLKNETNTPKKLVIQVREVRANELKFFAIKEQQIDSSELMGDFHPFNRRRIYHPFYLFPIQLSEGESAEVFIAIRMIGETITLNTQIQEASYFNRQDRNENFRFSLFFGFLVCITVIVSFIAFISRHPLLLSFALYCVSCMLMVLLITGYGFMYLWPNTPYWNGVGYLFVVLYFVSLLQMTKLYMDTAIHTPFLHRFFNVIQFLLLFLFAPNVLFRLFLSTSFKVFIGRFGLVVLILTTLMIIGTSIYIIFRKKNWGSFVFLLGFGFSIFAIIMFMLEQLGSIDTLWGLETTLLFIFLDFVMLLSIFSNQIRLTFVKNITLQEELTQSKLSAANALLDGQLEERARLSRQLHDGISIQIALLKMKLSKRFPQKQKLETEILQQVSQIADDIRSFSHDITPPQLQNMSIIEAIEDLCYNLEQQTRLNIQTNLPEPWKNQLNKREKQAVYLTLQELFNNTLKHSDATKVDLKVNTMPRFGFVFKDNGQGFDTDILPGGIGLQSIQARAQLFDASFEFQSSQKGSSFSFQFT